VPLIKIPRYYLVSQVDSSHSQTLLWRESLGVLDEDSITVDVPESTLLHWKRDYEKITKAKGIFKDKKEAILTHLNTLRQEW
jgi:hypothetical protein